MKQRSYGKIFGMLTMKMTKKIVEFDFYIGIRKMKKRLKSTIFVFSTIFCTLAFAGVGFEQVDNKVLSEPNLSSDGMIYHNIQFFIEDKTQEPVICCFHSAKPDYKNIGSLIYTKQGSIWNSTNKYWGNFKCKAFWNENHLKVGILKDSDKYHSGVEIYQFNDLSQFELIDDQIFDLNLMLPWEGIRDNITDLFFYDNRGYFVFGSNYSSATAIQVGFSLLSREYCEIYSKYFVGVIDTKGEAKFYDIPDSKIYGIEPIIASQDSNKGFDVVYERLPAPSGKPLQLIYNYFDLTKKRWSKPDEIFKGEMVDNKNRDLFQDISLGRKGSGIYCCWKSVTDGYGSREDDGKLGILFSSKLKDKWLPAVKISHTGTQPQIVIDNNGQVYVFWTETDKGLLCKLWNGKKFTESLMAIEDKKIRASNLMTEQYSYQISTDKDNMFHIVYLRHTVPEQLIYVKLVKGL